MTKGEVETTNKRKPDHPLGARAQAVDRPGKFLPSAADCQALSYARDVSGSGFVFRLMCQNLFSSDVCDLTLLA